LHTLDTYNALLTRETFELGDSQGFYKLNNNYFVPTLVITGRSYSLYTTVSLYTFALRFVRIASVKGGTPQDSWGNSVPLEDGGGS